MIRKLRTWLTTTWHAVATLLRKFGQTLGQWLITTWHAVASFLQKFWQTLGRKIAFVVVIVAVVIAGLVFLVWAILQGYPVPWTGFGSFTKPTNDFVREKTLWDWLELLIIPFVLGFGALGFNTAERRTEREIAKQRESIEREIASDRVQEALLQTYLDRMTELLLEEKLRGATKDSEVRAVAQARTITILRRLDESRRASLLMFLRGAGLIIGKLPELLVGADLADADLRGANLFEADLRDADLRDADLRGANLRGVNLHGADLRGANLIGADLIGADLIGADLIGADLTEADLTEARVVDDQLRKAKSLRGATMLDGTKHA